jgi:hypothetical protein
MPFIYPLGWYEKCVRLGAIQYWQTTWHRNHTERFHFCLSCFHSCDSVELWLSQGLEELNQSWKEVGQHGRPWVDPNPLLKCNVLSVRGNLRFCTSVAETSDTSSQLLGQSTSLLIEKVYRTVISFPNHF